MSNIDEYYTIEDLARKHNVQETLFTDHQWLKTFMLRKSMGRNYGDGFRDGYRYAMGLKTPS